MTIKRILLKALYYNLGLSFLFLAFNLGFAKSISYNVQEIIGYLSMVIALLFVFIGIRQYRENVNGGIITFGQGMKVGLLITLIPSLMFGLFDIVYTRIINPDFYDQYYKIYADKMKASLPPAEYQVALQKMASEKTFFSNPIIEFLIMFINVFLIGVIVTVISSLILKRGERAQTA